MAGIVLYCQPESMYYWKHAAVLTAKRKGSVAPRDLNTLSYFEEMEDLQDALLIKQRENGRFIEVDINDL